MWEIFSIGDSAYLAAIFNAVAMITGTGDFRQLAGGGFLMGVLLVLFQGILEGGRGIRFQGRPFTSDWAGPVVSTRIS